MSARPLLIALALLACLAGGCASDRGDGEVLVFAASSLADVAPELGEAFTAETGVSVLFSFGSSSALARQVAAGAPADLLISADLAVHALIVDEMSYEGAYGGLVSNELVLVTQTGSPWPAEGLNVVTGVAIGDWRAGVPVGLRARDWMTATGTWAELQERLVPCVDARATLAAVVSGSAQAGIVYATDAASTSEVRVVWRAPPGGAAVHYYVFELGEEGTAMHPFGRFLIEPQADAIFRRHGFVIEGTPGREGSS